MSDTIQLEPGGVPWQPSSDAELIETFVHYNMPIVGIVRQRGQMYLFRCAEGFGDTTHVWAYLSISANDLANLLKYFRKYGKEDFWHVIEANLGGNEPLTIALATDSDGILLAMDLKPEKGLSILDSETLIDMILVYGERVAKEGSKEERAVKALYEMVSG